MIEKKRFTLRKEYFGGLLHDTEKMEVQTFDKNEFNLLKELNTKKGRVVASQTGSAQIQFEKIINNLIKNNTVDADLNPINLRTVIPPIPIVEGTLMAPLRVYDTYGYGCNLHCARCLNESEREKLDLTRRSLKDTETIMRKFYDAGTMEWRFTGGEPTIYDDFIDSAAIAQDLGMAMMLNTNGCWQGNKYEIILNAGFSEIIISIEGRAEVNDSLRDKGVHAHIMRTIDAIVDHNKNYPDKKINVTLNQTVGKQNVDEIEYVVRLAASNGFNINFCPARPFGRATVDDLLTTEEFMYFSENVQRLRGDPDIAASGIKVIHKNMDLFNYNMPDKSRNPFPFDYSTCGALSTGFGLSPDGRVNACSFLADNPDFIGLNLAEDGVTVYDAWLDEKMEAIRKVKRDPCNKCDYHKKQCQGTCTAMVLAEGGKLHDGKLIGRDRYCFAPLMKKREAV